MRPLTYHRAASLDDAVKLLRQDNNAKLLAGGQTFIPTLKQRLAAPSALIDIAQIAALRGMRVEEARRSGGLFGLGGQREGRALVIGAGERHADVAEAALAQAEIPALAALAAGIGDPHVRHRGTLGGAIANNDPSADYPAACLALDAIIKTNAREIEAGAFFTGMFSTALARDEIVTEVRFHVPQRAAYAKFASPASRYAVVGVFVAQFAHGVRVAVTGAGPCVFRAAPIEAALERDFSPKSLETVTMPNEGLLSDLTASAEFRAHLVVVMARRALTAALT